jgi:hypothetical protein
MDERDETRLDKGGSGCAPLRTSKYTQSAASTISGAGIPAGSGSPQSYFAVWMFCAVLGAAADEPTGKEAETEDDADGVGRLSAALARMRSNRGLGISRCPSGSLTTTPTLGP